MLENFHQTKVALASMVMVMPSVSAPSKRPDPHALEYNFADELIDALEEQGNPELVKSLTETRSKSKMEFRKLVQGCASEGRGKPAYWANLWLACRGDKDSLLRLWYGQAHGGFGITSQEWSEAFHLWGVFKFYPASDFLVDWVSASNMLSGHGARAALRILYPKVNTSRLDWSSETNEFQDAYKRAIIAKRSKSPELFNER